MNEFIRKIKIAHKVRSNLWYVYLLILNKKLLFILTWCKNLSFSLIILSFCELPNSSTYFIFKWANPGIFETFRSFQRTYFTLKNCRIQQDSNSYRWSWGQARWPLDHHHCPPLNHFRWKSSGAKLLRSIRSILLVLLGMDEWLNK